jgi:hypothetical protein
MLKYVKFECKTSLLVERQNSNPRRPPLRRRHRSGFYQKAQSRRGIVCKQLRFLIHSLTETEEVLEPPQEYLTVTNSR